MATITFYSSETGTGSAWASASTFPLARSSTWTNKSNTSWNTAWGSFDAGALKYCYRGFFPFYVTWIPAGATITSAVFSVYLYGTVGTPTMGLILTTQTDPTSLAVGDYDNLTLDTPSEGATRVSVTDASYNDFTLNATGLSWLPTPWTDGYIKLGTREARDIDNGLNSTDTYSNARFSDYSGTASDPKLVITYTVPSTFTPKIIIC